MPYNPAITYRGGEYIAAGITGAAQGIAAGLQRYYQRREEKELSDQAKLALKNLVSANPELGASIGLRDVEDDRALAAAIKTFRSPAEALRAAGDVQQLMAQRRAMQQQEAEAARQADFRRRLETYRQIGRSNTAAPYNVETIARYQRDAHNPSMQDALAIYDATGQAPQPQQIAQLLANRQDIAARSAMARPERPAPGSAGFSTISVPGVGVGVQDVATGELIDSGKFRTERKADAPQLTQTELQQLQAIEQSARDLQSMEAAFAEIGDNDFGGPIGGRVRSWTSFGTDPNVSRINNLVTAATPNLARGVFREVGVLTDRDVERYMKLLPGVNDTAAQRAQKLADLKSRLAKSAEETIATLEAAGRDVSGLKEKILGGIGSTSAEESAVRGNLYLDSDGQEYPIVSVRGRRGIVKGRKFYPLQQ